MKKPQSRHANFKIVMPMELCFVVFDTRRRAYYSSGRLILDGVFCGQYLTSLVSLRAHEPAPDQLTEAIKSTKYLNITVCIKSLECLVLNL